MTERVDSCQEETICQERLRTHGTACVSATVYRSFPISHYFVSYHPYVLQLQQARIFRLCHHYSIMGKIPDAVFLISDGILANEDIHVAASSIPTAIMQAERKTFLWHTSHNAQAAARLTLVQAAHISGSLTVLTIASCADSQT